MQYFNDIPNERNKKNIFLYIASQIKKIKSYKHKKYLYPCDLGAQIIKENSVFWHWGACTVMFISYAGRNEQKTIYKQQNALLPESD